MEVRAASLDGSRLHCICRYLVYLLSATIAAAFLGFPFVQQESIKSGHEAMMGGTVWGEEKRFRNL